MSARDEIALAPALPLAGGYAAEGAGAVGRLERLPKWLNLIPMIAQWLWLSLRYGSWTLPGAANPRITAGGLVFIGATMDRYLRAFDAKTGKQVWQARLPASASATPMTYVWKGRQYVVVAVGGSSMVGNRGTGDDTLIAFALPD